MQQPAPSSDSFGIPGLRLVQAGSAQEITQARRLFLEYAESLNFSLCFQNFEKELAGLPGDYAPPAGRLLLAEYQGELAGCIALHAITQQVCEMKRFYLRPQFRGKRLGRAMVQAIIQEARAIGYERVRLDTVEPAMRDAVRLYRQFEFKEIVPYRSNPVEGAMYMELKLIPGG